MDRILCITGGSRGIGAATARLAARQGYAVAVGYLGRRDAAEALVAQIVANGGMARALQVDVALEASVEAFFAAVDRALGPLTALVNNAGVLDTQCRLEDMDAARLQRVFATNVTGSFLCAREAVRRMSTRHGGAGGAIVNVSSAAARLGAPGQYVDYAASKGAIDTFTVGLAKELATENIRVNAVRPGVIDTDIQSPGIHVLFQLENETIQYSLNDYLWGRCKAEQTAYDVSDRALTAAGAAVVYRELADLSHTYPGEMNAPILDWLTDAA